MKLLNLPLHLIIIRYTGNKVRVRFGGTCLEQDKITFNHGKIVNICTVYEISVADSNNNYPTLEKCLFGAVKLTENDDFGKYKYSGYGIWFDRHGTFSFPTGGFGYNLIIFRVDMSSSVHVDHKEKDILISGEARVIWQNSDCKKDYSIDFTVTRKKFCLSLHYNGASSDLFVNGTKITKFKAKYFVDFEIVATPLCLGNILKDFSADNMKKTEFSGHVCHFSDDYDAIAVDDILGIHK